MSPLLNFKKKYLNIKKNYRPNSSFLVLTMHIIALYTKKKKPVAYLQREYKLILLRRPLEMDSSYPILRYKDSFAHTGTVK